MMGVAITSSLTLGDADIAVVVVSDRHTVDA
jgi:hypothetical protein